MAVNISDIKSFPANDISMTFVHSQWKLGDWFYLIMCAVYLLATIFYFQWVYGYILEHVKLLTKNKYFS